MSGPLVYWNGDFIPQELARLPLNDGGFVFGATISEMVRTYRHQPFRLPDHLTRLRRSCDLAHIPLSAPIQDLTAAAEHLVRANAALIPPDDDLALVILATPGPIGYLLGESDGSQDGTPQLIMHTFPLPLERYRPLFRDGVRLVIPSVRHVPNNSIPAPIKHRSRLVWWLAEAEARAIDPSAIALLAVEGGALTETASANFLAVRDGCVISPPRSTILAGITLQVVEELCRDLSIPFREEPLHHTGTVQFTEVMLTSTPYGIAPVRQINDHALPSPGPIYQRLRAAFSRLVGQDLHERLAAGG